MKNAKTKLIKMILPGFVLAFFILIFPFSISHAFIVGVPANFLSLNSGLVGYWTFDGKDVINGVVRDKSGSGNHGNPVNIATSTFYAQGKIGQGFNFDGVNDYVDLSTSVNSYLASTSVFTISAWFKSGNVNNPYQNIVCSAVASSRTCIGIGSTPKINTAIYNGTTFIGKSNSTNLVSNKWYHIVMINDGSTISAYLDNTLLTSTSVDISTFSGASTKIGARQDASALFNGSIDDVRIYSRALSAQEVQQLYNIGASSKIASSPTASSSPLSSGLIGYWTFDGKDVVNGVALDKSGNGNNGNPLNIATSTFYAQGKIGQGFRFDGINDSVDTTVAPYNFEKTDPFSTSLWFKTAVADIGTNPTYLSNYSGSNGGWIVGNGIASICNSGSSARIGFLLFRGTSLYACVSTNPTYNKWHHLVTTYDGSVTVGGIKIYIDGVLQSIGSSGNTLTGSIISTNKLRIGDDYTNDFAKGVLDDVRVYNRVLSTQEVQQLYNMGASSKIASSPTASSSPLSSGLIGYWTFDGKDVVNGVARDKSGNGNHGNLLNIATSTFYAQGKIGQGFKFDGSNDYVLLPSNPITDFANPNSGCAWANQFDVNTYGKVFTFGSDSSNNVSLYTFGGSRFNVAYSLLGTGYGRYSSLNIIKNNTWVHLCYVWDGATITLYANGVAVNEGAPGSSGGGGAGNAIGRRGSNNDSYWLGNIDDVRIYNRVLSAQEVKQIYNMGR